MLTTGWTPPQSQTAVELLDVSPIHPEILPASELVHIRTLLSHYFNIVLLAAGIASPLR
jgi:hypothetical protein